MHSAANAYISLRDKVEAESRRFTKFKADADELFGKLEAATDNYNAEDVVTLTQEMYKLGNYSSRNELIIDGGIIANTISAAKISAGSIAASRLAV